MDESGRHVRVAVGCNSLPRNLAVEIEAVFRIEELAARAVRRRGRSGRPAASF